MIGGIHGKILHVDLTTGATLVEHPPEEMYKLLVGGRALIAYLLLRDLPVDTDAFSPDNLLIFAPGIMQGTNLPGSGRHAVGGKSPLTGAIASAEAGGWWGHEFKRTGYDALVVRGKAETPVYLWINNGGVEIRPADHLWGELTAPTQQAIHQELGDDKVRVAQIGPAGENRVMYAAVMHDINRAAGRNGLGALMGSKNLKAVAVRGTMKLPIAERKQVTAVSKWLGANYKELAAWAAEGIGRGTQDSLGYLGYVGGLPTQNFSLPIFENKDLLTGERNYEMFLKERDTCQSCPINCKQVFEHESDNPYQKLDPTYGGPEYESMAALGSNCGVEDNLAVCKAAELANAYGMDSISAGMSIAFAMECFANELITEEDTDGLIFQWGDGDLVVKAVEMIAKREGFGDVLAEGVARMSKRFGPESEPFNLTVKGQELPMHEPRLKHAMGLGYAVAPVGADHMMNMHDTAFTRDGENIRRVNSAQPADQQVKPQPADEVDENKMRIFYNELNWMHFQDCAINCHFYPYSYGHLAEALSGVTGVAYSIHDVLAVGARAQTLSRLFNLREGFTADDDKLPKRVQKAFAEGPIADKAMTDETFAWAKQRYYEMMGWDEETGTPTQTCLDQLQLTPLLEKIGVKQGEALVHPRALIKLFGYNAEIINKQTAVLSHEDSLLQLPFDANCLNWVLGHIISSRSLPLQLVGEAPVWTEAQRAAYRHLSTNVQADDAGILRLETLVADFNRSQERLVHGLNQTSYEAMCQPSGYRDNTIGDSLAYFHFHEAQHVGQILYLAQYAGKDGVWIA